MGEYNYGPTEHELAGGTFADCVDECETYLRDTRQGSVCGLRQKRTDFEGTLIESERANTNAHRREYATDLFGNDLTRTDSFGTPRSLLPTRKWQVIHDGPSRPMIESPDGRLLSISQFENGRWETYEQEEDDCKTIVNALNVMTGVAQ